MPGAKGKTTSGPPTKTRAKGSIGIYYLDSRSKRHQGKPDKCYYIAYRDSLQKLVWEKIGWASEGYTKEMAANIRAERMRAIRHGEELPKRRKAVTLGQVWKKYDEWLDSNKKKPWVDRSRWRKHLKDRFADVPLGRISPIDLENLKAQLLKEGKAPATVKHVLVLVRQLFNKAIAWEMWTGENPIKRVKLPKLNNRRERFLTYEEAHTLIEELEKTSVQLRDMTLVSLSCGLRAGEIFQLRWGHVDFNNGLIHVADSKSNIRKVPMPSMLIEVLSARGPGEPGELVFKDRNGMLSERSPTASQGRLIDSAGMRG